MRNCLVLFLILLLWSCDSEQTIESFGLRYKTMSGRDFVMPELTDSILAVEDFDGDGRKDLLLGGNNQGTLDKTAIYLMKNLGDGRWEDVTSTYLSSTTEAAYPIGTTADINGDGFFDVIILDKGNMEQGQAPSSEGGGYYGEAPILLLSDNQRYWVPSSSLANANRDAIDASSQYAFDGHTALHAKSLTTGDIDLDGDVDLFIESGGGWHQLWPHFSVNQGSGTFVSDGEHSRLPLDVVRGSGSWRYQANQLVDLDNDGYLDLVLGQLRRSGNSQDDLYSKVVINNGSGAFPLTNVLELPLPNFNEGWAYATAITHFDVNDDGYQDILIAYQRANAGTSTDNTGCYLQILRNDLGEGFTDVSSTYFPEQSMTASTHPDYGAFINSPFQLLMLDMNDDNRKDIVMTKSTGYFSDQFPFVLINTEGNVFQPLDASALTTEQFFGANSYPIDLNGDDLLDIISLSSRAGADGNWGTADDKTVIVSSIAQ